MTPVTLKIRSGCEGGGKGALVQEDLSATLATNDDQYLFQPVPYVKGTRPHNKDEAQVWENKGVANCLNTTEAHGVAYADVVRTRYIVRRLTPLECERLQGYPDGWTDIGEWTDSNGEKRQTSDAARYKALGNSIALPPWKWVLKRLCACYERDATMASLFDGIGGFPYLWEQLNGKGTCL
jgi:site-specific DNA-cytosine methylase